ncbi:hypothetical protein AC578_7308 [Pseudocercospora eumusae]|uniref:Mediator of RNA polymerase II transcription subunit 5 n=1 Tax=Pseudocercospora eumusae TaxID=321146 RepID=A0A139HWT5_9PEZI|nr:hypothetical protein AC578_7308 [Pseudocercospora eumusae]
MPYLGAPSPKSDAAQSWQAAFKKALLRRLRAKQLWKVFEQLQERHHARPRDIADVLLRFRAAKGGADDPLIFQYASELLKRKYITSSDLLVALLKHSVYASGGTATSKTGLPTCEERIFILVAQHNMATHLPTAALELMDLVHITTRWLKQVTENAMAKQLQGMQAIDHATNTMYEALGNMAFSIFGNSGIKMVMKSKWWKECRAAVVAEMENYDTHVLQWSQSQLAGRLTQITSIPPYTELDSKGRPKFSDEQILAQVSELPVVNSRAGFFVWLSAALSARPLTDDMTILSYLQGRYPNDMQSLVVDLLVASFDVLTNSLLTKAKSQYHRVIRSFIVNKVPLLITRVQANIQAAVTTEACIQMAMMPGGLITVNPLPPMTADSTAVGDYLKGTRLDFLQACALHGLVTEGAVSAILQEAVALPRVQKLNKDSLVGQCTSNASKVGELFEDLAGMQGNAGAIAGCIVETIGNLCLSKDTISLKSVCDRLIRRIPLMDYVMLFAKPGVLLLPVCNLLNNWVHDQDQTEFTPAYEEFASILLFALSVIHRYNLKFTDIGVQGDSFIAKLLDDLTVSTPTTELSAEQGSQLGKWLEGLFTVDEHGEPSGISDEVMRQCPPQSFYQLVPTLLEQSILACKANALKMKTFKGGLELLLEPFLLPSLIMGLGWLAGHSWEDHNDADVLLQVLEKLLRHSSSSQETQAMHRAVLAIVADSLYSSLEEFSKKQPGKKQVTELLKLLGPYINEQRTFRCTQAEIDLIINQGGMKNLIRQTIRDVIDWGVTQSNPPNPPPRYAHRFFVTACQTLDDQEILKALVEEVLQAGPANMSIALDLCTGLICAPTAEPLAMQSRPAAASPTAKLRDCVRLTNSNVQGLLERPVSEAEVLVRLGRRVEAQLAFAAQMPAMALPLQIPEQAADQMLQDLLDGNSANTTGDGALNQNTDMSGLDQQIDMNSINNATADDLIKMASEPGAMDVDSNQMFIELGMNADNNQQNQQGDLQNQEEDIFAGLDMGMGDMGDDLDFNFG